MIDCTVDSVVLIDILRGGQTGHALPTRFSRSAISHVTLAELLHGALKSRSQRELQRTLKLVTGMTLLHGDDNTAIIYAQIRYALERKGAMIPQNNIWIAAASIQADVPLITRDEHFLQIPGLQVVSY